MREAAMQGGGRGGTTLEGGGGGTTLEGAGVGGVGDVCVNAGVWLLSLTVIIIFRFIIIIIVRIFRLLLLLDEIVLLLPPLPLPLTIPLAALTPTVATLHVRRLTAALASVRSPRARLAQPLNSPVTLRAAVAGGGGALGRGGTAALPIATLWHRAHAPRLASGSSIASVQLWRIIRQLIVSGRMLGVALTALKDAACVCQWECNRVGGVWELIKCAFREPGVARLTRTRSAPCATPHQRGLTGRFGASCIRSRGG